MQLCCSASGVVQRVDEGLLREELEKAGLRVLYETDDFTMSPWLIGQTLGTSKRGKTLLEAAAKALSYGE